MFTKAQVVNMKIFMGASRKSREPLSTENLSAENFEKLSVPAKTLSFL